MTTLSRWLRWNDWRLSSRMAVLSLLLLLLVQALGFVALRAGIERNARAQLSEQLAVGERIWQRLLEQRAAKLTQGAAVLAADYALRQAVGTHDSATIVSALDNHGARIAASLAAFLDNDMRLVATADASDAALLPVLASLTPQLAQRGSALAVVGRQPYQFVMVPMKAPLTVGHVVMGFALDRSLAEDLRAVSGLDVTLVLQPAGGAPHALLGSLDDAALQAALAAARADGALVHAGATHLVRGITLAAHDGQALVARLSSPLARAIEPYRDLQIALATLTLLGLLLFGLGSAWTARRVTQPLRALARAAEQLGRGDYAVALDATTRRDEIGELAKAFDHMRVNIAAQQGEIRQLAYWDKLTALPNRVQFADAVRSTLAAAETTREPLAVLMLDLDRFKHVNDALGYASGDRLLQAVAERLRQLLRPGDLLARLGGDEFALLMPGADAPTARALADRLAQAFERPLTLDDQAVDLSAGVGIACWPEHAGDAETLVIRAEVAMYGAKARTAGAQVYDPGQDSASAQTLSLLSELRHALEHGELRLYLQPKVALADGRARGAEALLRWQHPQRGLVPPMAFIPFAERTGFIRRLTLWVFEQAARCQPALARQGVERLSVNLSVRDLLDHELPDKLLALLRRHGADARGFCLEITESAIMDDPQRAEATLNRLAALGFTLSIDDYGTGYSSLAYLQRLPVDELKIDKAFVMALARDAGAAAIVRSTIELAHNLGLSVVAEGVEDAAILAHLRALHCDDAQGYHLSRPMPAEAMAAWLSQREAVGA